MYIDIGFVRHLFGSFFSMPSLAMAGAAPWQLRIAKKMAACCRADNEVVPPWSATWALDLSSFYGAEWNDSNTRIDMVRHSELPSPHTSIHHL